MSLLLKKERDGFYMEKILIKNGNVLLFENNDVVIKKINVFINNGKIEKLFFRC